MISRALRKRLGWLKKTASGSHSLDGERGLLTVVVEGSPLTVEGHAFDSVARAINAAGVVVGGSDTSSGFSHATVWRLADGD